MLDVWACLLCLPLSMMWWTVCEGRVLLYVRIRPNITAYWDTALALAYCLAITRSHNTQSHFPGLALRTPRARYWVWSSPHTTQPPPNTKWSWWRIYQKSVCSSTRVCYCYCSVIVIGHNYLTGGCITEPGGAWSITPGGPDNILFSWTKLSCPSYYHLSPHLTPQYASLFWILRTTH